MQDDTSIQELTYRALQMERLLTDRKYEDIMDHLSYFETLEVGLQTLQQTDVIRVVYRVLKSCSQGAMKKKAKCLLSKWKFLYKDSYAHLKLLEEYHAGKSKESSDKEFVIAQPNPNKDKNVLVSLHSSIATRGTQTENTNSGPQTENTNSGPQTENTNSGPQTENTNSGPQTENTNSGPQTENTNSGPQADHCPKPSADNESQEKTIAEELRVKCRELLCQALSDTTECLEKTNAYAKELEESIHNMYTGNDKKYKNCVRSKVSNLRNPKNSHLKRQIYCGALSPGAFATMTVMEMASDELRKLRASYTQESVQEHQLPQGVDGLQTNKIKCRKCERFNCTVTMISRGTLFLPGWVRAGDPDEEMMTFVICNECGEKWYHSRWICL